MDNLINPLQTTELLKQDEKAQGAPSQNIPKVEPKRNTFLAMYQGAPSNTLQGTVKRRPDTVDRNDRAELKQGDLTLFIEKWSEIQGGGVKQSTLKLINAGIQQLTATNSFRGENRNSVKTEVTIALSDYMALRGIKDRKSARKQINEDCDIGTSMKISWKGKDDGVVSPFTYINIFDSAGIGSDGTISLNFGSTFMSMLVNAFEMKLPMLYWRINDKYNPNGASLLYTISLYKHMNRGKNNEDIVSVKALLEHCPFIPNYEDLPTYSGTGRKVGEKIIEPLERDLEALAEVLTWEYCNSKKAVLTDEQLSDTSYESFIKRYVNFTWKDYPQSEYLEAKKERDAERKKKAREASRKRGKVSSKQK